MPSPNIMTWNPSQLDLSAFDPLASFEFTAVDEWYNPPYRAIRPYGVDDMSGDIRAQVVVSEDGDDDLIITEHPVEQGAVINDHAFKRPAELRVQMGWSSAYAQMVSPYLGINGLYEQILELQASRLPFTVFTAKRQYDNMLIASLRTHTDAKLEFSFMADITFKEVVLVNTSVIAAAGSGYDPNALTEPYYMANTPTGQKNAHPTTVPANQVPPQ